jgi:PST family polysaccharide transporter
MKMVALLLGPAGVGLAGMYLNLIQTAAAIASLGISTVGVRQIARAQATGSDLEVGRTRQALFWGASALALVGGAVFWLASGLIAQVVFKDHSHAGDVAWLSIGVALTVAAGSQAALLTGLHKVGDLARINVGAGVIGASVGVLALWVWPENGLLVMILTAPAVTFVLGHIYVARLGRPLGPRATASVLAKEWSVMARLGFAFMASGVVTTLSTLVVRGMIQRELGTAALGQFQAAWAIGMTYLGFILSAMAIDYYPRLTAALHDRVSVVRLINEQTEVALLLCSPVLVAMIGFAPWVIPLLYSWDFGPAVAVLRWQLLGDILKVMTWPLGFLLLASGAGKWFFVTETLGMSVFVLGVWIGLPLIGVTAAGVAFFALYVAYLPLVWWLARCRVEFRWTPTVRREAAIVIVAASTVSVVSIWTDTLGAVVGGALAAILGLWALMRISSISRMGGSFSRISALGEKIVTLTRRKRKTRSN